MNRAMTSLVLACALLGTAAPTNAALIRTQLPTTTLQVGDTFAAHVIADELDGALVGGFDVGVSWNGALLALTGITFDSYLDGPADSLQSSAAGTADILASEVSLGVLAQQDGSTAFRMFELRFVALAEGVAAIGIDDVLLADANGSALAARTQGGRVIIGDTRVDAPAPLAAALVLLGLLLPALRRQGRPSACEGARS